MAVGTEYCDLIFDLDHDDGMRFGINLANMAEEGAKSSYFSFDHSRIIVGNRIVVRHTVRIHGARVGFFIAHYVIRRVHFASEVLIYRTGSACIMAKPVENKLQMIFLRHTSCMIYV